jgi:hypothetical protein
LDLENTSGKNAMTRLPVYVLAQPEYIISGINPADWNFKGLTGFLWGNMAMVIFV